MFSTRLDQVSIQSQTQGYPGRGQGAELCAGDCVEVVGFVLVLYWDRMQ